MKKLSIALLSLMYLQSQAAIVLHTNCVMTKDYESQKQTNDITLDEQNKGSLTLPSNIAIEFSAKQNDNGIELTYEIKKDEQAVANATEHIKWQETKTLRCPACPCVRDDISYSLEITPELQ